MMVLRIGTLSLVLLLTACAGAVGSGYGHGGRTTDGRSYADARADNNLTARINTLLVKDRAIPAMAITVTTLNKVVTLAGDVPSRTIALRAERLAASVSGVTSVINHLRVVP